MCRKKVVVVNGKIDETKRDKEKKEEGRGWNETDGGSLVGGSEVAERDGREKNETRARPAVGSCAECSGLSVGCRLLGVSGRCPPG